MFIGSSHRAVSHSEMYLEWSLFLVRLPFEFTVNHRYLSNRSRYLKCNRTVRQSILKYENISMKRGIKYVYIENQRSSCKR